MNSTLHLAGRLVLNSRLGCLQKPFTTLARHNQFSCPQKLNSFTLTLSTRLASTCPKKFEVINVQDKEDFKRVVDVSSSTPVVVDFHATWCGPCKLLGPRLEAILAEEKGKVLMAKVDIDDNSELAMEYGVRSVPTVIGMKNGQVQGQFIGFIDDDQIRSFVDKLIVS